MFNFCEPSPRIKFAVNHCRRHELRFAFAFAWSMNRASDKTKGRFILHAKENAKRNRQWFTANIRGEGSENLNTFLVRIIRREFDNVKFASHSLSREVWTGLNPHTQAVSSRCVGYRARFKLIRLPCGINKFALKVRIEGWFTCLTVFLQNPTAMGFSHFTTVCS